MATVDSVWYVSSVGYTAVPQFAINTAYTVGQIVRQLATPAVGSERAFICSAAGTSAATEGTWTLTRGAKTSQGTATFQEISGCAGLNGDLTNTTAWLGVKNISMSLGQIIKNSAETHYFICFTAGTTGNGSEPTWNTTTGALTNDNTVGWVCVGPVSNFTTVYGAPHARINGAAKSTWAASGNEIFVADNHSETSAAGVYGINAFAVGTTLLPLVIMSADRNTANPTSVTAGATINSTGTFWVSAQYNAAYYVSWHGITFNAGNAANNNPIYLADVVSGLVYYDSCTFKLNTTNASSMIYLSGTGASLSQNVSITCRNCTFTLGAAGQSIGVRGGRISVVGGSLTLTGSAPTRLFTALENCRLTLDGFDMTALAGGSLFPTNAGSVTDVTLRNCKLNASTVISGPPNLVGTSYDMLSMDSSTARYRNERRQYGGTLTTETIIVRTGGATDDTTPISWKVVTTANSSYFAPFECFPIAIWNNTTGSNVTATVYGIWGGASVPNNDEVWIEVSYMGSASTPVSTVDFSDKKGFFLSAPAAQGSDSSTWGGSTTAFKMSVTVIPQMVGVMTVVVKCAKPSTTFYIDPKVVLT